MNIQEALSCIRQTFQPPSYIMLVGVPGSGKSTFIKHFKESFDIKIHIASTDDLLEVEAARMGLTYSDAFFKVSQKILKKEMENEIKKSIDCNTTIIHDQTNMSVKARRTKLSVIPGHYKRFCLDFKVDKLILKQRLDERAELTGKVIPPFVMSNMFSQYQVPTKEEGFDLIIEVNNN